MKIGLVTIIDNNNYGNRLQNYALSKVLSNFGLVNTIINYPEYDFKFPKSYIKRLFYRMHILKKIIEGKLTLKRICNFHKFNKNINFVSKRKSFSYDYYVVGSDQVWNPYHGRLSNMDVLTGYDKNKCFSYAASFGVSEIKEKCYIDKISNEICKLKKISVREVAGKDILKSVCDRDDIEVLIDPTMLLSKEDWMCLFVKPKENLPKKYILNYFLGDISDERMKILEKVASKNNCEIINILDVKSSFYNCGPGEFLYLLDNAFLVCTDSFHSCVFAFLFNKPFITFDRDDMLQSMSSRIDTLLKLFKLESHKFNGKEITDDNFKCDYSESYKILNDERSKSLRFLKNALDIKDSE